MQALQDRIDQVLNTLQNKSPFVAFQENLKEAFADGIDFTKLGGAIDEVLPALQNVVNDTRALFGDGIGDSLDGFIQGLGGLADLSKSIGSFASGDIMGGVAGLLSAGNKLFGNSRKVNAEHREALELLRLQKLEIERQVELSELRKKLEADINVFGTDSWDESRKSAEVYIQTLKNNRREIDQLNDIRIVTGSRKSGWGPWKKRKDVYGSLLAEHPEIVDEETGLLNKIVAENVLANRKMNDADKARLQNLIDNADVMENAYNQLADNLKDTFGELGNTIADSFSKAAQSGVRDFSDMTESAGDMIEKLAKDMIYSLTLGDVMDKYTKEMLDLRTSGKSDETIMSESIDLINKLMNDAKKQEDKFNDLFNSVKNEAKDKGYDIFKDSKEQSSTVKASSSMTQDTGVAIVSRFTALQIVGEKTLTQAELIATQQKNYSTAIQERMSVMRDVLTTGVRHLADIKNHTARLEAIENAVRNVDKNTKNLIR